MKKLPKYVAMMALSMAASAALPMSLRAQDDRRGDSTDLITRVDDLPDAVRRTIEREAVGTNHVIDRRDRDDKVRYVVHFTKDDGQRMRIRVDEKGELIEEPNAARIQPDGEVKEKAADDDGGRSSTVTEDELPDRVRRTMDKFREGTHDPVFRKQTRDGKTFYSVHYSTPASERMWVRVSEKGEVAEGPHINVNEDIGLRIAGGDRRDGDRDRTARRDRDRDRDQDGDRDRGDDDTRPTRQMQQEELAAGDLPADIRRVIEEETAGGTEHRFVRETRNGRTTYFVEYTKDGKRGNLRLNERGRVIGATEVAGSDTPAASEEMVREELSAAQLPAEVRKTIEAETPGGTEHRFVREAQGGEVTYFVEYTKDGQRANLRVDERGKLLGETEVAGRPQPTPQPGSPTAQDDAELAAAELGASHAMVAAGDMPAEVRAAFEQQTQGGSEHIFQRHTENGRTIYTAHYRTAQDDHNIVVIDEKGQVLVEPRKSRWLEAAKGVKFEAVSAADLPAEVRQVIEKQTPGGREHLFVRRVRPEGEPTYLVQFTNAKGRRQQLEVNANGKVRDEVGAAQEEPFRMIGRREDRREDRKRQ